jgi:hypothetical protein
MKSCVKLIGNTFLFWLLLNGNAQATGCSTVDKYTLASTMNIDSSLLPILNMEIPDCSNIQLGNGYAGFVLNVDNQKINNGIRSEMSIDYPFVAGDTIEYKWSIMLPPNSVPGADANSWWLIAQWHDQPNPLLNETWATYVPKSPPVAVYAEYQSGVVGIGLQGLLGKKLTWSPVPTNTWLDLRAVIHWSTTSDGTVNISVTGHPELSMASTGQNMLNNYQHYLKLGQYRSPTIYKYAVVNIKNVKITKLTTPSKQNSGSATPITTTAATTTSTNKSKKYPTIKTVTAY